MERMMEIKMEMEIVDMRKRERFHLNERIKR